MTGAEAVGVGLGFLAIVAPEFWPKMPRALSFTLAGIGLSWLTYSGILGIEALSHSKLQYGPLGIIILGAILIGGGLFWHFNKIALRDRPNEAHIVADHPPSKEPDQSQPDFVERLRRASPSQLRELTSEVTGELRIFQGEITAERERAIFAMQQSPQAKTREESDAIWRQNTENGLRQTRERAAEFATRFRGRCLAIREEVSRRRGIALNPRPGEQFRTTAMDTGSLAGATPLSDLADYLDEIARSVR